MNNPTRVSAAASFRLQTLDEVILLRIDVSNGGGWVDTGLGEKPCLLLAILALSETPVTRGRLCELLWEGVAPSKARNSLRQSLFRIRRMLGPGALTDGRSGVSLLEGFVLLDIGVESRHLRRGPIAELAGQADRFLRTRSVLGEAFAAWRMAMQLSLWGVQSPLNRGNGSALRRNGRGPARSSAATGVEQDASLVGTVVERWRRAALGYPQALWLPVTDPAHAEGVRDQVARRLAASGVRMAHLAGHPGRYVPFALERDLAAALWAMPGAAGIAPEHRDAIAALATEQRAGADEVRSALRDLLDAVVEEMPLAITVANPASYSRQAIANLVGIVEDLPGRALLLTVFDTDGAVPPPSLGAGTRAAVSGAPSPPSSGAPIAQRARIA